MLCLIEKVKREIKKNKDFDNCFVIYKNIN